MAGRILLIDGMLSGTGIRDKMEGGYIEPSDIGLSPTVCSDLAEWLLRYEDAHYEGFKPHVVEQLDQAGLLLASRVSIELSDVEVGYFSDGRMTQLR
ncbi:hypothetical protein [Sphingobium sp. YR768]|jgi:hypothetical protein|uniref:hypothetical protein n=1 Tax=Sphingobium sp. YR768 TaxID=1884365 RepID=UPI000B813FC3|nr:hypothetical protein [Sphingobium sp. YR768]